MQATPSCTSTYPYGRSAVEYRVGPVVCGKRIAVYRTILDSVGCKPRRAASMQSPSTGPEWASLGDVDLLRYDLLMKDILRTLRG